MRSFSLLAMSLVSAAAIATAAQGTIYTDSTFDLFDNGLDNLDISGVDISDDGTNLSIAITTRGFQTWTKYMIFIDSALPTHGRVQSTSPAISITSLVRGLTRPRTIRSLSRGLALRGTGAASRHFRTRSAQTPSLGPFRSPRLDSALARRSTSMSPLRAEAVTLASITCRAATWRPRVGARLQPRAISSATRRCQLLAPSRCSDSLASSAVVVAKPFRQPELNSTQPTMFVVG